MDDGADGVCSTCSEERANRRENSAVQREYAVEESVPRCNYCRVATDEETPLDEHGYCDTCRTLTRCCVHEDLIAVGHCKTCRKEFCRKCLGFTDICQTCTAQNKTKPLKATPPPASASAARKKKPAAGAKTKRLDETAKTAKKGTGKRTAPLAEADAPKKKTGPTRGKLAIEERLRAKNKGAGKMQLISAAIIGAMVCIAMFSGLYLNATSPEAQAEKLRLQMVDVHRGVIHFHRKTGHLPSSANEIYTSLGDLKIGSARTIKLSLQPTRTPGTIIYKASGSEGFVITAADFKGELLKSDGASAPLYYDQYFDSNPNPPH